MQKLGRWLRWEKGFPTVYQGPGADVQPHTTVTVYDESRMQMGRDVAEWLGVPNSRLETNFESGNEVDVMIVIGQDFEVPAPEDELASQAR
ncbi:MAG: LytR C-terminal domain-containing protein [Dehalococcoidia bacterium]|nr:LytR C-terminal domain-containing protein [Dehalococcoidia bacterium]